VKLGDAVEIQSAPGALPPGTLKVASVRHLLSRAEGYVTIMGLTATSGSAGAGGASLGALAGALS
jgi:hypothetical protein